MSTTKTEINNDTIVTLLQECANEYILPRYQLLKEEEINTKSGPQDLVTQADLDVEEHLEKVLPNLLPGSVVIGEESISQGIKSLECLQDISQKIWVVDPVDGTFNFVNGRREFGIMLALVVQGRVEIGYIYDVLGEVCAIAQKGQGAYFGEQKLKVSSRESTISKMKGFINPKFFPADYQDDVREAMKDFKECYSLHCSAHEYLNIANGNADFVIYSKQKPWDHLAGTLLVEEAGGFVKKWDREDYTPQDPAIGLISAASKDHWEIVHKHFLSKLLTQQS